MAFFPLPTALDQGRAWNLDWRWGGDAARNRLALGPRTAVQKGKESARGETALGTRGKAGLINQNTSAGFNPRRI